MSISEKLVKLTNIIEAKYTASNNPHPQLAAKLQVELFASTVLRGQEKYADQLLDEEIAASMKGVS